MFYSPGDHNWWLGTFSGTRLLWRLVGNTGIFGDLTVNHIMWSGDFEARGKAAILFYSGGDQNWRVGYLGLTQFQWAMVSNTTGFGNVGDGRPIYTDASRGPDNSTWSSLPPKRQQLVARALR